MGERRVRIARWAGACLLAAAALGVVVTVGADGYGYETPGAQEAEGAAVGASSGVFDEEQRDRGAELYAAHCAHCHGRELGGGTGPPLDQLGVWWSDTSLGTLFRFVRGNMPMDRPGSLEEQEYVDIIAFVLHENGFPPGEDELPTDEDVLDAIVIDEPPAE